MSWDLNLCMQWDKMVLVPFHYLVCPQSQYSPNQHSSQPPRFPFLALPKEIQLLVYESCDLPTLFHLMHTCSHTRGPATKLFWANNISETHWYHFPSDALFDYRTYRHPILQHDLNFAQRITRIELNLLRLEFLFNDDEEGPLTTAAKAQIFWGRVQRAFPSVKRVVLMGMLPRRPLPPPAGEFDGDYNIISTVVESTPPHIVAHIAFDDGAARPRQYTLWQVEKSTWSVLDANWTPTRILLPPRKFATSPLGDLLTFMRRYGALMLEEGGLRWLKVESYARYATDGVIRCPRLDCDMTFTERESWSQHVETTSHWRLGPDYGYVGEHMMELLVWKGTPQREQDALEARQQRMDAAYRQTKTLQRRVGCGWNEEGTEQRRRFEEQFFAQLREENFVAPGELGLDPEQYTCTWIDCLWVWFDPTHVYYAGE